MRKLRFPSDKIMQLRPKYPIMDLIDQPCVLICLRLSVLEHRTFSSKTEKALVKLRMVGFT